MKKKKDSVYYQKDSITIKKNVKLSKIFRFFSIIICIFGLHNLNAQDFYWENPKTFVNADSFFPLVVKNSNESYVFWEEVHYLVDERHFHHFGGVGVGVQFDYREIAFHQCRHRESERHGYDGGEHEISQGADAQPPHFFHILHLHDAADD